MLKKILRTYALTFSLFLCLSTLFAQVDPPLRVEFESAKEQQDYHFVALGQHGVAVFYQNAILNTDTMQWVFIHYDNNLVRKNLYKIKLPNLCQYVTADFSDSKLYLFLQKPAYKKDTLKNYLLACDLTTEDFQLFDLHNYKSPYISSITVADDYLFIIIDEPKWKSMVFYNYMLNEKQTLQITNEEITSFESFCIDTLTKTTYGCLFVKNKNGSHAELFVTDFSGKMKGRLVFPIIDDMIYNSARIAITGKDSLLITGGYSSAKTQKQKGCYSGIFTLPFTNKKFAELQTYPLGTFLAKEAELNTKNLGESNLAMNGRIRQSNGRVFFITEVFYPEYQYTTTSSYRGYGYYGYDSPTRLFAGFRFLNAYILEFNAHGLLLHEWYFPMANVITQSLYHLVDLYQTPDDYTLFYYVYKNEIISQYMYGQQVLAAKSATPVVLSHKTDILEYSSNISMQYWHGNSFLLSGYQYIKNSQWGKGKRYVFFLNKLICE